MTVDIIQEFEKHEKDVAKYVSRRVTGYYQSGKYERLSKRMETLKNCYDIKGNLVNNSTISRVSFPIVKERQLLRRAITSANFVDKEVFSLTPAGDTTYEDALTAEMVLNLNCANTKYVEKVARPLSNIASIYGTGVLYTYWKRTEKPQMRTVYNDATSEYTRVRSESGYENAHVCLIDLDKYFQNPECVDSYESDFQGHIREVTIAELMRWKSLKGCIPENIDKAIENLKKGRQNSIDEARNKSGKHDETESRDSRSYKVEVVRYEGIVGIEGNEDDDETYVIELIGDLIIRITREDYDYNNRSYDIVTFDKRIDAWYGMSDGEYVVTHENYLNMMLGMTLDNALRAMQQYVFFDKSAINMSDIANVWRNDGFVPVDTSHVPINNIVSAFQAGRIDMSGVQFGVNAVQQSIQQMGTKVDLQRKANEGGMGNTTATAASIIAGQGDILENDLQQNFNVGICANGARQLAFLQQFLPQLFSARANPKEPARDVNKYEILGDHTVAVHSAIDRNRAGEMQRMQNLASWWLNIAAAPSMQGVAVNLLPVIREVFQLSKINVEEVMPSEASNPMGMQVVPTNPMAMPGGAPQPLPQPPGMAPSPEMMAMQGGAM